MITNARVANRRLTPASLDTHVIRYCHEPRLYKARDPKQHPEGGALHYARCHGHRESLAPAVVRDVQPMASRKPRGQAAPMLTGDRVTAYYRQNRMTGKRGGLTARQHRQIVRMSAREQRKAAA